MAQRLLHRLLLASFLTIPMAQRLLHRLLLAIFFDNPNGTATVTQTSFGNLFWQSQWHSNCYTDFFWQFLLTIPMAQRLLHRLLLAISFDNPNGTATVTQTSFDNLFRQSQWHSDSYTDFFWQSFWQSQWHSMCHIYSFCWLPLHLNSSWHRNHYIEFFWHTRMCDNPNGTACAIKLLNASVSSMFFSSYTRPSDQTQRPRLVLVKGPCSQPANTLHPNAQVIATCPLDWHFPMEGRRYNLKSGRTLQQSTTQWNASDPERTQKCKTKSVLHTTAIPWAHKLVTKAQRMQTKKRKSNKRTAHNSKKWCMNYRRIRKNHQNTVGTQANDKSTKNANEKAQKQQTYCAQQQNMMHELPLDMKKIIKILWSHKLMTKAQRMHMKVQKQRKYCAQQQNMMHELPLDMKKSSKYCGHTS